MHFVFAPQDLSAEFHIDSLLGNGGFAHVVEATDLKAGARHTWLFVTRPEGGGGEGGDTNTRIITWPVVGPVTLSPYSSP